MLLIFLLEAMVGILAYVYEGQVDSELRLSLNSTFLDNYKFEEDATLAIDRLQREYKCCGAIRFEDWRYSRWLKENSSSLKGQLGCIYRLATELQDHLNILGAIGLGLCVVQVFGMVFACSLYIKLKDVIEP
ncbi:hypothetical protein B566_EDAN013790 [Ephemera danica]|nr:hypothetical protein B566_EDAN013790 [Ephemera danica]